jgi:hypothetical protein
MKTLYIRLCVIGMIALFVLAVAGCGPKNHQGGSLTQNGPVLPAAAANEHVDRLEAQVDVDELVSRAAKPAEPQETVPQQDASALLQIHCVQCHRVATLEQTQKQWADWERILSRMERTGVRLTDDERSTLLVYLAAPDKR